MSDIRITSKPVETTRVTPVSETLPKEVPVERPVQLPENLPTRERRRKQRRRGRAYRRPLIELRTGHDRRRGDKAIDVEA
ncbi:hypothetical protein L1F30_08560 [Simiduia sp. 21SJ11W-1]|uniref:hypothetical protein n=1 Tax=Simiduia sp. 21SJ11W-1 TaxID=2909669 RepID=UPI00209C741F|nr:hypothetical protein [Simiduia sp. 21SJ11W-1]UTA49572.1 hypothetical protein L1F30_08560 [Simiduia sp. 21SJ11W-1]